jgi:uncharacterized protein YlxW (UPF0749 family)
VLPKATLYATLALATFLLGWLVTAQLRSQLLPASNPVARNEALLRSVADLEAQNAASRERIRSLREETRALQRQQAGRSLRFQQAKDAFDQERLAAGQTELVGPGLHLTLDDGKDPNVASDRSQGWLVRYQDLQDLVNLLWAAGADGITVNQQRVVPSTSFFYAGVDVLMNNGIRLAAPFQVQAIGSGQDLEEQVRHPDRLTDFKKRARQYKIQFTWRRSDRLTLPAYDSAFLVKYATPLP